MQLYNATPFAAAYSLGLLKSGRNCLVVVAKATFELPAENGGEPRRAQTQIPPHESDTYTGEPGYSAPEYENDFAPLKHRCDVILLGSAHANQPTTRKRVALHVGQVNKAFDVVGAAHWTQTAMGLSPSGRIPFTRQPIRYDTAFGGTVTDPRDPGITLDVVETNPVGQGYYPKLTKEQLQEQPLPLTEAPGDPIVDPRTKRHRPMALGPVARNWAPRRYRGGTYDQHWIDHIKPFLPEDFDERYYQCAPEDQQTDFLRGGETVTLIGLHPHGDLQFRLPTLPMTMQVILANGDRHNLNPVVDTLTLEPDENRFTWVWRARIGLQRGIHEVDTLIVGKPSKGWERARMMDKPYVPMQDLQAFGRAIQRRREQAEKIRRQLDEDRT